MIELPQLGLSRKIKGIQMFKRPSPRAVAGDRAAFCVAGLDAALVERGIAATPGSVPTVHSALALVRRVSFFRGRIEVDAERCWVWFYVRGAVDSLRVPEP